MDEFVKHLLLAAERAATIARCCREEESLIRLLVEEKRGEDNTKLCGRDFKTLADVLIQETITHYIAEKAGQISLCVVYGTCIAVLLLLLQFPSLRPHIYGEESTQFTNGQNQTITVRVCDTEEATAALLAVVMDDNERAAQLLAHAVHQPLEFSPLPESDRLKQFPLNIAKLGVWIDPIGEYMLVAVINSLLIPPFPPRPPFHACTQIARLSTLLE